jgi:hypothetical protein
MKAHLSGVSCGSLRIDQNVEVKIIALPTNIADHASEISAELVANMENGELISLFNIFYFCMSYRGCSND